MKYLIFLMLLVSALTRAEPYIGFSYAAARFGDATGTSEAMARKLHSEGVATVTDNRLTDTSLSPVLGYRFGAVAVELGRQSFAWRTNLMGSSGPTQLINSDTGAATAVSSVAFRASGTTVTDLTTVRLIYSPNISYRAGLIKMDVCSSVFEASTAVGRTPEYVESRAGTCRSDFTYSLGLGYTTRGSWGLTVHVDAVADFGNDRTVFVDGGGVGNQTLVVYGLTLDYAF